MNNKDKQIIPHLRNNAREFITNISVRTNLPATTIYDRVKSSEKNIIKRYTALVDFKELGYDTCIVYAIKTSHPEVHGFLINADCVNTLHRTANEYNYIAETIFKDLTKADKFQDELSSFSGTEFKQFHVLDELKKESFLTKETHFG